MDSLFSYSRAISHLFLRLRQRSGMSQKELALQAGVSLGTVRTAEKDGSDLYIEDLFRLTETLGVRYILFIFEAERRTPPVPGIRRMTQEELLDYLYSDDRFARFKAQDQLEILSAIDPVPPLLNSRTTIARQRPRSPRRIRRPLRARTR